MDTQRSTYMVPLHTHTYAYRLSAYIDIIHTHKDTTHKLHVSMYMQVVKSLAICAVHVLVRGDVKEQTSPLSKGLGR